MKNAHILIVDDQESIRHFVEKAMVAEGYQVSTAGEGQDAIEPLQKLIAHIEPLKLPEDPRGVGIPFDTLDQHREMKTLMAMLIQNEIFFSNVEHQAYVLNPGSEMAQKILVFIKMGLTDSSKQKEVARFLSPLEATS